jgi:pentatricopeptide repeat protein
VALEIFAADANFAAAQEAVDDMAEHKVRRSPEHLAHLIAAYQAAGRPREAADVIAAAADVTPDTTSFNAALKACVEGRLGAERVLEVYASMQAAGAAETAETYAYVVDQCLLAEGPMPAAGWVSEKMREKGFNLDRVGARVVEKLLDQERVDEAWERFINWKPAKGRWSSVLYEKMLEGLLNKNLVEDVGLHVSEMQRHKIGISSTLWPRVRAIGNPYASAAEARLKALEAASGPGPAAPAAVTDSKPAETSEAQRVEAVKEGEAKVKGPLHALSESLVNRAASQSKFSESLVNKPASKSSESLMNKPASESSESFVNKATKRLNMKEVWTPKGRFFTGPKVVPGEATEASSQGGAAGQGVPSSSAPQGGAAEPSSRGGASSSAPPGGVQGGASSSARTGAVSERPAGGVPASGTDVPGELEPYWKLIQVQLQKGRVEGAAETLADVQHMGLVPTASMYKELVVACAKKGLKDTAWGLIRQMQESGHIPTPDLFEALR